MSWLLSSRGSCRIGRLLVLTVKQRAVCVVNEEQTRVAGVKGCSAFDETHKCAFRVHQRQRGRAILAKCISPPLTCSSRVPNPPPRSHNTHMVSSLDTCIPPVPRPERTVAVALVWLRASLCGVQSAAAGKMTRLVHALKAPRVRDGGGGCCLHIMRVHARSKHIYVALHFNTCM